MMRQAGIHAEHLSDEYAPGCFPAEPEFNPDVLVKYSGEFRERSFWGRGYRNNSNPQGVCHTPLSESKIVRSRGVLWLCS